MTLYKTKIEKIDLGEIGIYVPSKDRLFLKSFRSLKNDCEKVEDITSGLVNIEMYKFKTIDTYIIGFISEEGFENLFHISLRKREDVSSRTYQIEEKYASPFFDYSKWFEKWVSGKGLFIVPTRKQIIEG